MKPSNLLMLLGGLLAAAAFFLPFSLSYSGASFFGSGVSLLDVVRQYFSSAFRYTKFNPFMLVLQVDLLLEPAGAVLLILRGILARWLGRKAFVLGLIGAVLSLTVVLWSLLLYYEILTNGFRSVTSPGEFVSRLGLAWWCAIIGCVLGLLGALLGWLGQSRLSDVLASDHRFRFSPWALLMLVSGLALAIGFFFTSFYPGLLGKSLFGLLLLPNYPYVLWPDLLAMLLLLICGLVAFTGRKGMYLGGLSGALVGIVFLLLFTGLVIGVESVRPELQPEVGYWLTIAGCALGLLSALLG